MQVAARASSASRASHAVCLVCQTVAGSMRRQPMHTTATRPAAQSRSRTSARSPRFFKDEEPLTLDHFLLRGKVLGLYRNFIRNTRGLGDLFSRHETVRWIRSEFEQNRKERDITKIKSLIAGGKRQLKQLSSTTMLVGNTGDKYRGLRQGHPAQQQQFARPP